MVNLPPAFQEKERNGGIQVSLDGRTFHLGASRDRDVSVRSSKLKVSAPPTVVKS